MIIQAQHGSHQETASRSDSVFLFLTRGIGTDIIENKPLLSPCPPAVQVWGRTAHPDTLELTEIFVESTVNCKSCLSRKLAPEV